MRDKVLPFSNKQDFCTLVRVLFIVAGLTGLLVMAGCGGGSSSAPAPSTPGVSLSATTLTFAAAVGATQTQMVTVADNGSASDSFTGFSFSGTNASDFSQTNTCGTGISAGANCTVSVTFTSSSAGSGLTATLSIADNASGSPQTVALTATAAAPTATLTPTAGLTFNSQGVGSSSAAQTATLTNTGTVPVTISSAISITGTNAGDFSQTNNCPASGSTLAATTNNTCTINVTFTPTASGTRTATLSVSDNATGSSQTIPLSGTGAVGTVSLSQNSLSFSSYSVGTTSSTMSVTVTNSPGASLTIASIVLGGTNPTDFALTTGTNQCTYAGQTLAAGGSCSIYVDFTPASVASFSAAVTITDNSGGVSGSTQNISLSGAGFNNTVQVNVSLGPNGNIPNAITTTVTVCVPGTSTCTTIPDVIVDTESIGLRLLASGAVNVTGTQVGSLGLPTITDSSTSYPIYECYLFGSLDYAWGPLAMATVTVGGETASEIPGAAANTGIPIQIITTNTPPEGVWYPETNTNYEEGAYYNPCLYGETSTGEIYAFDGGNDGTVSVLGANGLLGISNAPQDCAVATTNYCTNIATTDFTYLEYDSAGYPGSDCSTTTTSTPCTFVVEPTPLDYQAWNPVSTFPVDNTGSILSLPTISTSGSPPLTGTLTFGIGTETNNAITSQTVYEVDEYGNLNYLEYNGVQYTSEDSGGAFLDSGTSFLYISDETALSQDGVSVSDCISGGTDTGLYCPSTTQTLLPLTVSGINDISSPNITLNIANEVSLVESGNAAFNDLGGPSCEGGSAAGCTTATDFWDLGLPFFFGRPVYVGISNLAGTGAYPNGYWAF